MQAPSSAGDSTNSKCIKCGAAISAKARFCLKCGAAQNSQPLEAVAPSVPSEEPSLNAEATALTPDNESLHRSSQPRPLIKLKGNAWKDGFTLLLLGSMLFLPMGMFWQSVSWDAGMDFRTAYSSARCLTHHCDPYNPIAVRMFNAESGMRPLRTIDDVLVATHNVYPPSEFTFTIPFTFLPYSTARMLWGLAIALVVLTATWLMWLEVSAAAPILFGGLLGIFLINSSSLIAFENPAGIAVGLCVIAAWCFVREKVIVLGVLCMVASLSLKPQDAGLVWLYFFLSGGRSRKYALQTLVIAVLINLPMLLWVIHLSPHWLHEIPSNLASFTKHGGSNDPASLGGRGMYMNTSLQTVFSSFWDNPRFYNSASYAVCAPLLVAWATITIRSHASRTKTWICLAIIAALSMLPIYHRQYDAKLILLAIPACSILMVEAGRLGRWAIAITGVVIVLNGDWTWIAITYFITRFHIVIPHIDLFAFPVPFSLLLLACFYLLVLVCGTAHNPSREAQVQDVLNMVC